MKLQILKKDGNGGHSINIPLAVIALIVTVLIAAIPAVVAYGAWSEKVNNLEKQWDTLEPQYDQEIAQITNRVVELENIATGTGVSLITIQKDVDEIKTDLKGLIKIMIEANN